MNLLFFVQIFYIVIMLYFVFLAFFIYNPQKYFLLFHFAKHYGALYCVIW